MKITIICRKDITQVVLRDIERFLKKEYIIRT